jgi:predicted RNA-binding protein with PIN domain
MPYLIDGHNLIPKIPGISLRAVDDEVYLIQRLQEFCRYSGKQVEVFFDRAPTGQVRSQAYGRVKAHFVRTGRTADDAIISRLQALARSARNWTVVSSDRYVQTAARAAHAKVISSEEFAALLLSVKPENGSDPGGNAELSLNASEINEWLDLFGGENENGS